RELPHDGLARAGGCRDEDAAALLEPLACLALEVVELEAQAGGEGGQLAALGPGPAPRGGVPFGGAGLGGGRGRRRLRAPLASGAHGTTVGARTRRARGWTSHCSGSSRSGSPSTIATGGLAPRRVAGSIRTLRTRRTRTAG